MLVASAILQQGQKATAAQCMEEHDLDEYDLEGYDDTSQAP